MNTGNTVHEGWTVPWWAALLQGIFALIIGLLLLTKPVGTMVVLVQFLGIYWLVSGIFSLIGMFIDNSMWGWKLLSGVVGIMAGISILNHPMWSTLLVPTVFVFFMGVNGIIIGIVGLIEAFKGGGASSGILGALSLLFGFLLLGSPYMVALALPWVYGIFSVVGGIAAIFSSLQQKKIEELAA